MNRVLECADCGRRSFYAKFRCLDCASAELLETEPGTGELLAITTVHVVPDGVREPNALGLAAFDGRANVIAQLEGDLEVGDSVRLAGEYELRQGADGPLTGGRLVAADS